MGSRRPDRVIRLGNVQASIKLDRDRYQVIWLSVAISRADFSAEGIVMKCPRLEDMPALEQIMHWALDTIRELLATPEPKKPKKRSRRSG
jgi:hypothetical protein